MAIRDTFPGTRPLAPLPISPDELIDEMLACYAEWRQEVAAVDETYRRWCTAPTAERDRCFGVYIAALDQEESAAMTYAVVAEEVRALLQHAAAYVPEEGEPRARGDDRRPGSQSARGGEPRS